MPGRLAIRCREGAGPVPPASSGAGAARVPSGTWGASMDPERAETGRTREGPAERFTGGVRLAPPLDARGPARGAGPSVAFEPGARTVRHAHPLGRTLIGTAGQGWAQREGGP